METTDILTIDKLLRLNGLYSSDIKIAMNNKQLKLNGYNLTVDDLNLVVTSYDETGEFIYNKIELFKKLSFLSIDEIFECNIPYVRRVLEGLSRLKLSKKKSLIIKLNGTQ
jgi:hypothetical protein